MPRFRRPLHRARLPGAVAALLLLSAFPGSRAEATAPNKRAGERAQIKRGEFLITIGGCNDCHTPMKLDPQLGILMPQMERMLSGHPAGAPDPASKLTGQDMAVIGPTFTSFRLPFGVVYAPNLTPDRDTGLGSWTEEMFLAAMRTGRHMGGKGRPILPPMPWMGLSMQSDDDLKAMFAFLRSIPPIRNGVPEVKVPQPVLDTIGQAYDKILAAGAKPTASAPR